MAHNRKLVIGSVASTQARLKRSILNAAMDLTRDDLEREIIESGYLNGAPFRWVGLIIREGLIQQAIPHYERINSKHGDLPIAMEIVTHRLLNASMDEAVSVYRKATLAALVHAGEKYGLSVERLRTLLAAA